MFQPNSVIAGRYQVVRLVGQGGMSNLYLAYDRKYNNATVVVKEMTASYSDPNEQQMAVDLFHREAKLLASLNHRHIPKVYDYFQFAGKYYLSMEYIDGGDLAVKLEESKAPLPENQVLEWGEQIAQVLFYLHKHEPPIVFRDVKPSNIMISSQGVKLIDFGIARHFDQAKKGDTMRIGSPGYAPPEQYAAQTDPRSDIYALGVTLHHALTGRDPTATSTPFLVPPARDLNPNLSEATAAMLARATQLDPSDRYQSALEMKKDIKHILQRGKQSTRVVGAPPAPPTAQPVSAAPADASQDAKAATTPAAAASSATPAAAQQQASASAPATTTGPTANAAASATGSGSLAATPAAKGGTAKKKGKKFSFSKFLMVAFVLIVGAGGAALATMEPQARSEFLSAVKVRVESFINDVRQGENPEDKLRQSLLAGDPTALLPLFQSSDFQAMSKEKQELFRLNLLAAGSAEGNLRVIHLLLPEGAEDASIWKTASAALGAINGSGGLENSLYAVVPKTYRPGQLDHTLGKLSKEEGDGVHHSFLVFGGEQEKLSENSPENVTFYSASEVAGRKTVPEIAQSEPLSKLFGLDIQSLSEPTVWAVPGPIPDGGLESQTPIDKLPDASALAEMLTQASNAGGRLVLLASQAGAAKEIPGQGELLLLSTSAAELPALGPNQKGSALALTSPFETSSPKWLALRPSSQLSPRQARLFDALALSAAPQGSGIDGLTIRRTPEGEYKAKVPTKYQWTNGSWLPELEEKSKNE